MPPPVPNARPATSKVQDQVRTEIWSEVERIQRSLEAARGETASERFRADQAGIALDRAQRELDMARAELARRDEELRHQQLERAASSARVSALVAARDELAARVEDGRQREERLSSALELARAATPLHEVLAARGLVGPDEPVLLFRGLAEHRQLGELLPMLTVDQAGAALELLLDRVSLWCGRPDCPVPPGRAVLRVAPGRCDVCGGLDLRRSVRRFVDAALVHGARKVTILGGAPAHHRQIRSLLTDSRVALTLLAPKRAPQQAPEDLAVADALLVWHVMALPSAVAAAYVGPRVAHVHERALAPMLEAAASFIERLRG